MKTTIDQIGFNKVTLQFTLFISFRGNQERIPIDHNTARALLDVPDGISHLTYYSIHSDTDFLWYVFQTV